MRILFISPFAYPQRGVTSGPDTRVAMWLGTLTSLGHAVDVLRLPQAAQASQGYFEGVLSRSRGISGVFPEFQHQICVDALHRKMGEATPDFIIAYRLQSALALRAAARASDEPWNIPLHFDLDDLLSVQLAQQLRFSQRFRSERLRFLELPTLRRAEAVSVKTARSASICSTADLKRLRAFVKHPNINVVPNLIQPPTQTTPVSEKSNLLFVGNGLFNGNLLAVLWFLDHVWPRILASKSDATLSIVGNRFDTHHNLLSAYPRVSVFGFQNDLGPHYAKARAAISPTRFGSGTRIKLLEAAAHARPAVSTSIGADGLELTPGKSLYIADEPQRFADRCLILLRDQTVATRMGQTAQIEVLEKYGPGANRQVISKILQGVVPDHQDA